MCVAMKFTERSATFRYQSNKQLKSHKLKSVTKNFSYQHHISLNVLPFNVNPISFKYKEHPVVTFTIETDVGHTVCGHIATSNIKRSVYNKCRTSQVFYKIRCWMSWPETTTVWPYCILSRKVTEVLIALCSLADLRASVGSIWRF